ncbi:hypothetical protein H2204_005196 [Knufia peltigerae]|uniref:Ankyrin repeat protein n=1 Tax=Knufia peltigerae TaxID=1002370 RepID=A0AA39D056_9EURO|nr:hypothetical protein H2204_005196 [Knufia peltigerae]
MADPLGIMGVIGVVAQIIQLGVQFGLDWNDAPADTKSFIAELEVLSLVLSEMKKKMIDDPESREAFEGSSSHSPTTTTTASTSTPDKEEEASPEETDTSVLVSASSSTMTETPVLISTCRYELEILGAFLAKRTRDAVENLHRRCQALNSMAIIDTAAIGARTYNKVNQMYIRQQQSSEQSEKKNDQLIKIQRKAALMRKLYTSAYRDRKDRNPRRVKGTCEWFTHHPLFQTWKDNKSSCLLRVSADPGCGKSVLAKYLVDEVLRSSTHERRTTCYFFFKDDFVDQRTSESCMCCILRQIFTQRPKFLSEEILTKFEEDGDQLIGSFRGLWDILIDIINTVNQDMSVDDGGVSTTGHSPAGGEIICVLDALDECEDRGQRQFAEALRNSNFGRTAQNNRIALKFLLTSRPYTQIQRDFGFFNTVIPAIHLDGEGEVEVGKISKEINVVIESKIKDLTSRLQLLPEEQQTLKDEMNRIPHRTYLWVHLIFEIIQDSVDITKESLRLTIRNLPTTIEAVYDKILGKTRNPSKAKKILHIVVAAERPLVLKEMAVALAIKENHRGHNDLELEPETRFRSTLREICGLFVTVIDSKIYLLHQTAKEFLVQETTPDSDSVVVDNEETGFLLRWKKSLQVTESHRILAEICMWRLLWDDVAVKNNSFHVATTAADSDSSKIGTDDHILLDYSAQNWVTHFHNAQIDDDDDGTMASMASRLCDQDPTTPLSWFKRHWNRRRLNERMIYPTGLNSLIIASFCGLECVVVKLLAVESTGGIVDRLINSRDDRYKGTPLAWAAEYGHEGVVRLLIARRNKIDVDSENSQRRTPLSFAAEHGHEVVLKMLLDTDKVDADAKSNHGRSPLSYAAAGGHERIVEMLLLDTRQRVDPDAKDSGNRTPLFWAAWYGRIGVVNMLLLLENHRIDVDRADDCGRTPLLAAARNGREEVIKSLLNTRRVDVNHQDSKGRTPLWHATRRKHVGIVQLLRLSGGV